MDEIWNITRKYYFADNYEFYFFLVLTPTGLLLKLFNKDILKLKRNNYKTYWIFKDNKNNSMKNQF